MPRVYVRDLRDGDNVNEIYLLADRQLRANRNANLYFLATLRDRSGMISGLMWNVTEDSVKEVSAGDFVRVKGKVQQYQGNLQLILTSVQSICCDFANCWNRSATLIWQHSPTRSLVMPRLSTVSAGPLPGSKRTMPMSVG
jgi:hypothetical protein